MKSLSIVIPTYNRVKQLVRLLTILDSEIKALPLTFNNVTVLVRDNSENFETSDAVARSVFAQENWLDYRKNENNLGFDLNILNGFADAPGDFVWLVGDDDIVSPGGVKKLLDLIQLDADMYHLPFRQPQDLIKPQYQLEPHLKYWKDIGDIVEQVLKNIKITSFVYKKSYVKLDTEKLTHMFSKSGWMHVVLAFEVLVSAKKVTSISINEFLAGSLDAEWKEIAWTPAAYLTSKSFYEHEIFRKFNLDKQVTKFEKDLYFAGLEMTWLVTRGVWATSVPMDKYLEFGARYPFSVGLLISPILFLKYFLIRFKLGPYFKLIAPRQEASVSVKDAV